MILVIIRQLLSGLEEGQIDQIGWTFFAALLAFICGVYFADHKKRHEFEDLKRWGYLSKEYNESDYLDLKDKESKDDKLKQWKK